MDSGNCNARPMRGTQSDSRSDKLKRRVTTATPVRSPMEQGKEPSQRRSELTAHEWVRQEDIAHSPRFVGDFAWRLSERLLRCTESHVPSTDAYDRPFFGGLVGRNVAWIKLPMLPPCVTRSLHWG